MKLAAAPNPFMDFGSPSYSKALEIHVDLTEQIRSVNKLIETNRCTPKDIVTGKNLFVELQMSQIQLLGILHKPSRSSIIASMKLSIEQIEKIEPTLPKELIHPVHPPPQPAYLPPPISRVQLAPAPTPEYSTLPTAPSYLPFSFLSVIKVKNNILKNKYEQALEECESQNKLLYERALKEREEKITYLKAQYKHELDECERNNKRLKTQYENSLEAYRREEDNRVKEIVRLHSECEARKDTEIKQIKHHLVNFESFKTSYLEGDATAVENLISCALISTPYPDILNKHFRLAYSADSKEFVIDQEIPSPEIIPAAEEYKFIQSRNTISEKERKLSEIKQLYHRIAAIITLRTIYEVFWADEANHIDVCVLNLFVTSTDRATGKDIRPCILSVRVTKVRFMELNILKVDPLECLKSLNAHVSPSPTELVPVKPIVEFDMVDKRFVAQQDILTGLDSRPNIMDLNPYEFEALVGNLFAKMGLESKLTRSHKDGGVDVVAFDLRPVIGGKVVIQAKRYRHTVGVSAVRDLFGTMTHEGANKGILVTTSGYGPDAYNFATDKPIELIDGGKLLYLLNEMGIKAKIIMPPDEVP